MKAIVDCNSFYCSCERVFRPALANKPVVVLSNNDGCVIARSDEAKALGIGMTGPYFKEKPLIEKHGVATFSSNYNLYGDLSRRVMDTLRSVVGESYVEVYSVDEAFIDLAHIPKEELEGLAVQMRSRVEQWTGIKVSVGIAPTKVLAKVANRLSKKNKEATQCILVLDSDKKIEDALRATAVGDVWGVGYQYAEKLKNIGVITAFDLSRKTYEWAGKNMGGVVGVRLIRELKAEVSIMMEEALTTKKMISSTRMFGSPVSSMADIQEAVATYTTRAAEKLRRQFCAATVISVFIVPKEAQSPGRGFRHGPSISNYATLPVATSLTNELIKPAVKLAGELYEKGRFYKKAGVTLSGIVADSSIQGNLFVNDDKKQEKADEHYRQCEFCHEG